MGKNKQNKHRRHYQTIHGNSVYYIITFLFHTMQPSHSKCKKGVLLLAGRYDNWTKKHARLPFNNGLAKWKEAEKCIRWVL